jgi:uncharacterized protein YjbK
MLEHEKKIMLTMDEYEVIAECCKDMPVITQINYYFDTEDLSMNKRGITCRIRAKNGKYRITIKNHNTYNPSCSIEEHLCEGSQYDSKVFEALGLYFQGELVTSRIVMYKDDFCEVVLDMNFYLGHTDFEIEVEYSNGNEDKAIKYLKNVAKHLMKAKLLCSTEGFISRIGNSKNKSERFFEKKELISKN